MDHQGRLSIQSLHSLRPCSSAASLLLKIGPWIRLISTIEPRRPARRIVLCEYHSNRVANVVVAEPLIKNFLYRSISHCLNRLNRALLSKVLRQKGYQVLEACD